MPLATKSGTNFNSIFSDYGEIDALVGAIVKKAEYKYDNIEAMVVSGNVVQNCSIGLQQRYRKGVYLNETDYLLNYTGSLFTFQDILRVEFHNNSFAGVYPMNDWDFYRTNSPFRKHLALGVSLSFNST